MGGEGAPLPLLPLSGPDLRRARCRARLCESFRIRQYELCTRADYRPRCWQAARAAVFLAVIISASEPSASSSTCILSGTEGNAGFEIGIEFSLSPRGSPLHKALSTEPAEEPQSGPGIGIQKGR